MEAGNLLEAGVMRTKALVVSEAHAGRDWRKTGGGRALIDASLPKAYSIQHLRNQAVDLLTSKEALVEGTSDDRKRDFSGAAEGSLLDVIPVTKSCRQSEDLISDTLLILHVEGANKTQLVATILSAPRFVRQNNEAAFADYDYYLSSAGSSRPVTPGILREHARQRDEEEAEQGLLFDNQDDDEDKRDDLLSKRVILHTFPSRIYSIEFGQSSHSSGMIHRGPWVCIRTIFSTLFATVELSTKREKLLGHSNLRLVSLLEISHGDSILPSGIQSQRYLEKGKSNEPRRLSKSKHPIVDVRFHPERATEAVTVDSMGNIGLFTCDLFKLAYSTWADSVSWSVKQRLNVEEEGNLAREDNQWKVQWAETEASIILADRRTIAMVSLDYGSRSLIYTCPEDATICSITRSEAPDAFLWVATTRNILLFDLKAESQYKPLLSWEHNRSHAEHLQLVATTGMRHATALLVSNPFDCMMNMYIATVSPSGLEAMTRGESKQVDSSLEGSVGYACGPRFLSVRELGMSWHRWIRRISWDKRAGHENEKIMIEMGSNSCITLKAVTWSYSRASSSMQTGRKTLTMAKVTSESKAGEIYTDLDAERSLHSFSSLYHVLMAKQGEASLSGYNEALKVLKEAERWLQEQESLNETLLLPHDLVAICNGEETHSLHSALMRVPLLPSFHLDDAELSKFLSRLWATIESDAYVLDLDTLLQNQLASRLSLKEAERPKVDLSVTLAQKYTPDTSVMQGAAQQIAQQSLGKKLLDSSREIRWDMLLSSQVVSMRPITIEQQESIHEETPMGEEDISPGRRTRSPIDFTSKPPNFSFAFFTPRLPLSDSSHSRRSRRTVLTPAARYLLSEWQVGDDPKDYHFQHPYRDVEGILSGSEDFYSQSDTDQRGSQRRSSSIRSMSASQFDQGSFPSQAFSQPLPPTIGSASQSSMTPVIGLASRFAEVHASKSYSQPINVEFASSQRGIRPKKRRVGGF